MTLISASPTRAAAPCPTEVLSGVLTVLALPERVWAFSASLARLKRSAPRKTGSMLHLWVPGLWPRGFGVGFLARALGFGSGTRGLAGLE
jgi:hypothetical protein